MKTPQVPAMPGMSPLGFRKKQRHDEAMAAAYNCGLLQLNQLSQDQKTIAERKWQAPSKPNSEQKPCDHGLFSDDSKQTELF